MAYLRGRPRVSRLRSFLPELHRALIEVRKLRPLLPIPQVCLNPAFIRQDPKTISPETISLLWQTCTKLANYSQQTNTELPLLNSTVPYVRKYLRKHPEYKNWVILEIDHKLFEPYREQIKETLGFKPALPNWMTHVSIVRGQTERSFGEAHNNNQVYNGKRIEISLVPEIKRLGTVFYLDVATSELCQVRKDLGLSPRPNPDFHLTLGKAPKGKL